MRTLAVVLACLSSSATLAAVCPGGKRILGCRAASGGQYAVTIDQCRGPYPVATLFLPGPAGRPVPGGSLPVREVRSRRPGAPVQWAGKDFDLAVALTTAPNRDGTFQGRLTTRLLGVLRAAPMACK